MSHLLRKTPSKIVFTAAVVVVAGGALAGVASAVAPPPLDHQLCYMAAASGFKIPQHVILRNAFSPAGFMPKISGVALHCNPVRKTLPDGRVFPITNPNAHLLCFNISAAQPDHTVVVSNQFGTAKLLAGVPRMLCLPSWKSLTGPPGKTLVQPPGLDHFTCYPVIPRSGVYHPPAVQLQDEFAPRPVTAKVNNIPVALCMPTQKTVGGVVTKIIHPRQALLCFPVSRTPMKPAVFDQNQFGTSRVVIVRTFSLCLPSSWRLGG